MGHCSGGPGPNQFDHLTALEQWVEKGVVPDKLIATHSTNGKIDRTRPLCPYPQVARWKGAGAPTRPRTSRVSPTRPRPPPESHDRRDEVRSSKYKVRS